MRINKAYSIQGWNLSILIFCLFATSCSIIHPVCKTPSSSTYGQVNGIMLDNGYSKQRELWVAYSDRDENSVNPKYTTEDNASLNTKKLKFLTPLIVLKHRNGMLKVAEYSPELINDGKLPKKKKKSVKIYGWIPEDRLLLWNNSLKSTATGFIPKATLVIHNADVINNISKYIEQDSIIVFNSPDLINKTNTRVALGSIVYVYKLSNDNERFLIGDAPGAVADSAKKHIYGWVSKNIISFWGERYSVTLKKTDSAETNIFIATQTAASTNNDEPVLSSNNLQLRTNFENIFPVQEQTKSDTSSNTAVKFFINAFNYDSNKVYNVLGNLIYYKRFREIQSNNKKLNIVFVLDISQNNRLYIPIAMSLLQQLQLKFTASPYFSSIKFGGVIFKQDTCGVGARSSLLSSDYRDIISFFERKTQEMKCSDDNIVQPVDEGLSSASKMMTGVEDETNIILLIGTTASANQTQSAINALTKARARAIIFQTQSKSDDAYNDFVLLAEKAVINSAENITELKKEKIVNQQDLLLNNRYDLAQGGSGVYSLDFPQKSMMQGFVIFPNKGATMQANILIQAMDSLLVQVTEDNRRIDSTLTAYFRSDIGVNNTTLVKPYDAIFKYYGKHVPASIASSLLNQNTAFLFKGFLSNTTDSSHANIEYGIFLTAQEYELLQSYYSRIANYVLPDEVFNRRRAIRRYVRFISKKNPTNRKIPKSDIYGKTMNRVEAIYTGYVANEKGLMNRTLKDWKRKKDISDEKVLNYFNQHQELAKLLETKKGDEALRVYHEGKYFYWLTQEYIPMIKQAEENGNKN